MCCNVQKGIQCTPFSMLQVALFFLTFFFNSLSKKYDFFSIMLVREHGCQPVNLAKSPKLDVPGIAFRFALKVRHCSLNNFSLPRGTWNQRLRDCKVCIPCVQTTKGWSLTFWRPKLREFEKSPWESTQNFKLPLQSWYLWPPLTGFGRCFKQKRFKHVFFLIFCVLIF